MATLANSPLFARGDTPPDSFWISLQYFNLYRIVISLVFLGATYFAYEPTNFGAHDLSLFRTVCVGYLVLGIALQFTLRSVRERVGTCPATRWTIHTAKNAVIASPASIATWCR